MRLFLESFRLPGEAQKINRIMESFGSHYHRQCPHLFKNADAVYILAYSVILLNTDQHNSQASPCCQGLPCSRGCRSTWCTANPLTEQLTSQFPGQLLATLQQACQILDAQKGVPRIRSTQRRRGSEIVALPQVKKKMTSDEFIRNNRGINAGDNLPQDFLRALYESISRNEIRISSDASAAASPVLWTQLAQASLAPRGELLSLVSLREAPTVQNHSVDPS